MRRIKNPLGSSRRGGLGAGLTWLKYDASRTARPPLITAVSPAPARRGSPSISAGMHGGCHVSDERSSFTERMQGIAAGLHGFVSLEDLAKRVAGVHGVPLPRAKGEVLVFLRDRPAIPLYARRPAGWSALQDRDRLNAGRLAGVINPGLHGWGPSGPPAPDPEFRGRTGFFGIVAAGRLPERLLSAVGVRLSDVGQSLGLTDDAEPIPSPAPAAVQSEPPPEPEQPSEPVWKDGDHWTLAAVAEMVRLHEQEGRSLSDIGRVMGDRVGGPAISRQRVREKIPDSVRGGKGKCKGARG